MFIGLGLLIALSSLDGTSNFISWKIKLIAGIASMIYGSYKLIEEKGKKEAMKYVVSAFSILIIAMIFLFRNDKQIEIKESNSTEPTNYSEITTCEEGKNKAYEDIEKGKLCYIFGGFGSRQELAKNLEENYDIDVIRLEGVLGLPNSCYNDVMYEEIKKRYGNDIFNKAMME